MGQATGCPWVVRLDVTLRIPDIQNLTGRLGGEHSRRDLIRRRGHTGSPESWQRAVGIYSFQSSHTKHVPTFSMGIKAGKAKVNVNAFPDDERYTELTVCTLGWKWNSILVEIRWRSTLDELLFLSLVHPLKGLIFALAGCEAAHMWYFMCPNGLKFPRGATTEINKYYIKMIATSRH